MIEQGDPWLRCMMAVMATLSERSWKRTADMLTDKLDAAFSTQLCKTRADILRNSQADEVRG